MNVTAVVKRVMHEPANMENPTQSRSSAASDVYKRQFVKCYHYSWISRFEDTQTHDAVKPRV